MISCVVLALNLINMDLKKELLEFLEANNWFSLEDKKNAEGVIDAYIKAYKSN